MRFLHKVSASSLKTRVIVTERKSKNTISVMDTNEFMKAVKAPMSQFVADAISEYNKTHPGMEARLEILVSKKGKWKALGSAPDWNAIADALINSEDTVQEQDLEEFGLTGEQAKKALERWLSLPVKERQGLGMHHTPDFAIRVIKKAIEGKTMTIAAMLAKKYNVQVTAAATPWGASQSVKKVMNGLTWHSTAGHGGLCVSKGLADRKLSSNARAEGIKYAGSYWYEEDALWAIPMYENPDWLKLMLEQGIFSSLPSRDELKKKIETYFPGYFEAGKAEIPEFKSLREGDLLYIDKEDSEPYTVKNISTDKAVLEKGLAKYGFSKKSYFSRVKKATRDGKVLTRGDCMTFTESIGRHYDKEAATASDAASSLIRALAQALGNKRYLHDLEALLKRLEPLSSHETETLWHLIRDLEDVQLPESAVKRLRPW
jgi:hypothetical protein